MQRMLLAEPKVDLKRVCELAQGMEAALKDAKEIQSIETDLGTTNCVENAKSNATACSRCLLEIRHKAAECRHKATKCNKCHRTGHLAKACKSKSLRAPGVRQIHKAKQGETNLTQRDQCIILTVMTQEKNNLLLT